ncbi:MAG: hypothetical protein ACPLZ9_01070 [Candidatus Ratteibacteria bacterium]
MKKFLFLVFIFNSIIFSEEKVGFTVYAGKIRSLSDIDFNRIVNTKEVTYVLTQEGPNTIDQKAKERYKILKEKGKKVIIDIWWGPDGEYNWDKYNFPDISQNEKLRNEFFEKVIEPVIEAIGPENIYGVHMLEETGLWYGYEKTIHPYYKIPDINTSNIRKYNWLLKKDTGFDMDLSPIWNDEERFVFWRWVCKTISSSSAHKVFCEYIHKKYPKIKAFQFEGLPDYASGNFCEYKVMIDDFDGIVTDSYTSSKGIYMSLVGYRTMAPKKEIVALVNGYFGTTGTDEEVKKIKEERVKYAYLAGMNGIGFFEPDGVKVKTQDFQDEKVFKDNIEILKPYITKNVYKKKRDLLIVPTNISVGGYGIDAYLPYSDISDYDMIPATEFRLINPDEYKVIVILGPNYPGKNPMWNKKYIKEKYNVDSLFDAELLNNFVEKGGVLIISGLPLEKGSGLYFTEKEILYGSSKENKYSIIPNDYAIKKLKLKEKYEPIFTKSSYKYNFDTDKVISLGENTGYLISFGKGYFLILPQIPVGRIDVKIIERENFGKFLTDIIKGISELRPP